MDSDRSERVEAGPEQAELIALGIGKNDPGRVCALTHINWYGPKV